MIQLSLIIHCIKGVITWEHLIWAFYNIATRCAYQKFYNNLVMADFMEQRHSWKADRSLACQEIHRILWNLEILLAYSLDPTTCPYPEKLVIRTEIMFISFFGCFTKCFLEQYIFYLRKSVTSSNISHIFCNLNSVEANKWFIGANVM